MPLRLVPAGPRAQTAPHRYRGRRPRRGGYPRQEDAKLTCVSSGVGCRPPIPSNVGRASCPLGGRRHQRRSALRRMRRPPSRSHRRLTRAFPDAECRDLPVAGRWGIEGGPLDPARAFRRPGLYARVDRQPPRRRGPRGANPGAHGFGLLPGRRRRRGPPDPVPLHSNVRGPLRHAPTPGGWEKALPGHAADRAEPGLLAHAELPGPGSGPSRRTRPSAVPKNHVPQPGSVARPTVVPRRVRVRRLLHEPIAPLVTGLTPSPTCPPQYTLRPRNATFEDVQALWEVLVLPEVEGLVHWLPTAIHSGGLLGPLVLHMTGARPRCYPRAFLLCSARPYPFCDRPRRRPRRHADRYHRVCVRWPP